MKYKFEKIDDMKPAFEENLHLMLGNAVHETLEEVYKKAWVFITMNEDETVEYYNTNWLDKVRQLKEKNPIKYKDDEISTFYARGKTYIEQYYSKHHPFNQGKLFATEQTIHFDLSEKIWFTGKIDRLDMDGDNIIINDYKTNTKISPDTKDKVKEQIDLYGFAIKQQYASKVKKVFWRVYYLHFDTFYEWEITDELVQKVQTQYLEVVQEIEAKKKLYKKWNESIFETKTGTHCQYCPFMPLCPARRHQYMKDEHLAIPIDDADSIKTLLDKYKKVWDEIAALEAKKELYKEFLVKYAQDNNLKKIFSDHYKANVISRDSYAIDEDEEDELMLALQEDDVYQDLLSFDKNKFTKAIKQGKVDFDKYEDKLEYKKTTYLSRVSEKKKDEEEEE
jgi:RecB family exonuclease